MSTDWARDLAALLEADPAGVDPEPLLALGRRWLDAESADVRASGDTGRATAVVSELADLGRQLVFSGCRSTGAGEHPGLRLLACAVGDRLRRAELERRLHHLQSLEQRARATARSDPDLFERVPVMMHSIGVDGRLIAVSDAWCRHLGYTRAEVLGRRSTEFLTPASQALARAILPSFFASGRVEGVPYEMVTARGDTIDVLLSADAERDANGALLRSVAVLVDVTEHKRTAQRLARREADLADMARATSHDLQEPLRDVIGHLGRIANDYADQLDERGRRSIDHAVAGGARMRRSITALRTYARLATAGPGRDEVDLAALVRRVIADRGDGADVHCVVGPLPTVVGARAQLEVLVHEVIDNASTFRDGERVRIDIDGEQDAERTILRIADDGVGLPAHLREAAFDLFSRFDPARAADGAGLGLALCRRVADNHGARVWLEAAGPQGGARFVLEWPAAEPA